jgi:hypothetical protein
MKNSKHTTLKPLSVLDSVPFHVFLWIMVIAGLVGNALVIAWRCTRSRPQRGSVLSIAIILLAVADLLYSAHLFILESSVARHVFGGSNLSTSSAMDVMCRASGNLSLLSCSAALWMTLNIAVYSCQVLTRCYCRGCSLLRRKGCLFVTIICQLFLTSLPLIGINIYMNLMPNYNLLSDPDGDQGNLPGTTTWPVTAAQVLSTCTYAQTPVVVYPSTCPDMEGICLDVAPSVETLFVGTAFVSLNSILSLACAFVYLAVCIRLHQQFQTPANASTMRSQGVTELSKLKWRLASIVLINTLCWMTVTIIHVRLFTFFYVESIGPDLSADMVAICLVLVSISPAINPLIYTIAGKQFKKFLKRCWEYLKCQVVCGRPREMQPDNYLIGQRRCSCIPCMQCVRPQALEKWDTERASLFSSTDVQERSHSLTAEDGHSDSSTTD